MFLQGGYALQAAGSAATNPELPKNLVNAIVIGEMRDLPTISTAVTAAETGHLVLGTLHTIDAAQSVDRITDIFPEARLNRRSD